MDWTRIIRREKELSSLQLEKPDTTYQVWEFGSTLASIERVLTRLQDLLKTGDQASDMADLLTIVKGASQYCEYLCKRLSDGPVALATDTSRMQKSIDDLFDGEAGDLLLQKASSVIRELEEILNQVGHELRAKSVHLGNVFSFSFSLKRLREKLMYEINSKDIEQALGNSIDSLEKLEKGDKILTSPNLEVTRKNLRIIKTRLDGIRTHLSELREFAKKNLALFQERIDERLKLWEDLILDIRNPSDYLSQGRKLVINVVPVIVWYYLAVIPIVAFSQPPLSDLLKNKALLTIIGFSGLVPLYLYFLWGVYRRIRDRLEISSFKFKISDFRV